MGPAQQTAMNIPAESPERSGAVLVVPACGQGRGGGHLFRSIALVRALRSGGREAWLYPVEDPDNSVKHRRSGRRIREDPRIPGDLLISEEQLAGKGWSLIVLDRYRCPPEELDRWRALGPVAGIDEGLSRRGCDFLIDLLPGIHGEAPNLLRPSLLFLPKRRRPAFKPAEEAAGPLRVLISFGAEDPAGLGPKTAAILRAAGPADLSIIAAPGTMGAWGGENSGDFRESLADYDLLITHFGITAFEALHARLPVLLLNPGPYHEALARRGGLFSAGWGRRGLKNLSRLFRSGDVLTEAAKRGEEALRRWVTRGGGVSGGPPEPEDLAGLISGAVPLVHRRCPFCGSRSAYSRREPVRFSHRTYRRCSCGMVYMDRLKPPPVEYTDEYFFSAYRNQYGKTYLEDFSRIQAQGERRLGHIRSLLKKSRIQSPAIPRLLDIGCAYGPFLAAARDGGFKVLGLDPGEGPVRYVREKLGINAVRGCFPGDLPGNPGEFEVITLWYVVEHFIDPGQALGAINRLLKTGGIVALATPSLRGVSRWRSLRNFLERSPEDHWTLWDPLRCGRLLRSYGFRLKKRVITGHHPERFPLIGPRLKGPAFRFFLALSVLLGLGDTFEIYAVKGAELPRTGAINGGKLWNP